MSQFGMALTRPSLTMQLTSGVDVSAHVCRQKADALSHYCDNIQPYDKTFQFLSNLDNRRFSFCQILTSKICRVVWQHTEVLYGFCWKFTSLSSSESILKIH